MSIQKVRTLKFSAITPVKVPIMSLRHYVITRWYNSPPTIVLPFFPNSMTLKNIMFGQGFPMDTSASISITLSSSVSVFNGFSSVVLILDLLPKFMILSFVDFMKSFICFNSLFSCLRALTRSSNCFFSSLGLVVFSVLLVLTEDILMYNYK